MNSKGNDNHYHAGIRKTAEKLIARYGGKHLEVVYKNHASVPAARELLTNLSHECDFLITAAGD